MSKELTFFNGAGVFFLHEIWSYSIRSTKWNSFKTATKVDIFVKMLFLYLLGNKGKKIKLPHQVSSKLLLWTHASWSTVRTMFSAEASCLWIHNPHGLDHFIADSRISNNPTWPSVHENVHKLHLLIANWSLHTSVVWLLLNQPTASTCGPAYFIHGFPRFFQCTWKLTFSLQCHPNTKKVMWTLQFSLGTLCKSGLKPKFIWILYIKASAPTLRERQPTSKLQV